MAVPDAAVGIYAHVYSFRFQGFDERNEGFGLSRRLPSGKGHSAAFSEKRFLVDGHFQDFTGRGRRASVKRNRIRIGTVQTFERASL